jgi:hypothetical protein
MKPNNKFKQEKELEIIKMYLEGKTQKYIAEYYNTYNTSIRRVLLRYNISLLSSSTRQSFVNDKLFKNLKDKEVQYWLGMLMSDGCVYLNRITLQLKDLDHIKKFKHFLGNKVKIKNIYHKVFKTTNYRIDFRNKEVTKTLYNWGIKPNKSKTAQFNYKLTYSTLLGLFDGDGSIVKSRTSVKWNILTASEKLSKQIIEFLEKENFHPTITQPESNLYSINLHRKLELNLLFDKLYNQGTSFLTRKYVKFGSFIGKPIKENLPNSGKASLANPELASRNAGQV